ncbi:hypothetical protein WJX75_004030 [Coccomyxa subellipsoidea]|uniref:CCT domain-containing protein n=1 Tax=Coccomyxa subellipsoidea TaxID=248742 RepID=A0ABR2YLY4_9CHLO
MTAILQEALTNVLQTPSKEFFGETEQAQKTSLAQVQIAATLPSPPELNSAAKKSLESWFPLRKPLLRSRAGSGRPTSQRTFKLQLRVPEQAAEEASVAEDVQTSTPGLRRAQRAAEQDPEQERLVGNMLLALLQEARGARRAAMLRRGGSGRAPTARPLDVTFHRAPQPPTPYCPTPEVVMEVASLPRTPGTALRAFAAQSDARSTVARRSRSASFETPMEGVPERSGFVLQPKTPKTPALAFTPMEGVPERLDPMLPATCARRRLHTTTPGPRRALGSVAADGRLLTPGDAAVLASGGDPDHDSPVEGLLQQSPAVGHQATAAAGEGSSSGSFAFSRAAVTPAAPQQLGARMEQASVDPLGFFAADGGRALHRTQGVDSLDGAPATSPWHLRDYNPSPMVLSAHQPAAAQSLQSASKRMSLGQPVLPCSLQPSPEAAPNSTVHSDDDGDDDGFGGDGGDWGDEGGEKMDHMDDGAEEDAEMEEAAGSEHTPVPEEPAEASALAGPGGNAAADPSHTHGRIPVSCNKRLKREFRARKSLAGVGLQPSSGRRRSTRVSCKPLEWWRNERKVYERKFHSLPTVDHMEVYSTTPTWTFVSDYKKKTKARTK